MESNCQTNRQNWGNRRQHFRWVNHIRYEYGPNARRHLDLHRPGATAQRAQLEGVLARGQPAQAEKLLIELLDEFPNEPNSCRLLGAALLEQGKVKEAHDLLKPVYDWFTEGFDTADLKDAKSLLDALA